MDKTKEQKQIEKIVRIITRFSAKFRNPNIAFMTTATNCAKNLLKAGFAEKDKWTPVEKGTPESGEHCLLTCEIRPGKRYVCDGYFAKAKTIKCEDSGETACEYDEATDEFYLLEGWYEVIKNWDDFTSIAIQDRVTHWKPLPEFPEEKDF